MIYEAFVEGKLEAPKRLAPAVHDLYFEPKYEEFRSWTIWSSFQCLHFGVQGTGAQPPIQGNSKMGEFLEMRFSQSF